MRALAIALTLLAGAAQADESAIQGVIDRQLDAFRADDFATAFTFAAPTIQGMFGTPGNFGRMVMQGYPMVWRPATVEYLGAEPSARGWSQDVLVTDAAGRLHKLRYMMVETDAGWKIAGVQLLTAPEVGV
jgi:hypothetical protein